RLKYTNEAIEAAVQLSSRYIHDRKLPDKAIDVIDESGAARDVDLLRRLDGEPQHRHEVAQRSQLVRVETVIAPRGPAGIEAVHQAERAVLAEAVHEGEIVLVALFGEFADLREIHRWRIGEIDHHLLMAMLEHVEEHRAAPACGRIALGARAVFERIALVAGSVAPAEAAPLIDRMQRVDDDEPARQFQALGTAALAEAAKQVDFGQAREALAGQPVHQRKARGQLHARHYGVHS
ncbi:MAG: hypothetical protein JSV48_22135, partial [Bradyrhizobium sp.]